MDNLKDVYLDQLQDLFSANKQAKGVTGEMAKAADNDSLRQALERGVAGINDGRLHLQKIIATHGADPGGEHCKGMEGLAREARAHALDASFGSAAARDAMIVTQYQRMAHYAIAGYGCALAFARQLGLEDDAKALKEMLEAAYSGDRTMTDLAESEINKTAA